jgi:hypothetical protein
MSLIGESPFASTCSKVQAKLAKPAGALLNAPALAFIKRFLTLLTAYSYVEIPGTSVFIRSCSQTESSAKFA